MLLQKLKLGSLGGKFSEALNLTSKHSIRGSTWDDLPFWNPGLAPRAVCLFTCVRSSSCHGGSRGAHSCPRPADEPKVRKSKVTGKRQRLWRALAFLTMKPFVKILSLCTSTQTRHENTPLPLSQLASPLAEFPAEKVVFSPPGGFFALCTSGFASRRSFSCNNLEMILLNSFFASQKRKKKAFGRGSQVVPLITVRA